MKFDHSEKEQYAQIIQRYFEDELETELGQFDAIFLFDFICDKFGSTFYNKGIEDATVLLNQRVEAMTDDLYALKKDVSE